MNIRTTFISLTLLTLLSSPLLLAEEPMIERGFSADKAYHVGNIETIDMSSAGMTLRLPIGGTYPVGGDFSYGLTLHSISAVWDLIQADRNYCETPGVEICFEDQIATPTPLSNAGMGWRLSMGELFKMPGVTSGSGSPVLNDWVYISPSGSRHQLHTKLHERDPASAYSDGTHSYRFTRNGSYLRVRMPNTATEQVIIEFPNGQKHAFSPIAGTNPVRYRITSIVDPFGNSLSISYNAYPATEWTLTDSHGRTHTVELEPRTSDGETVMYVKRVRLAAFDSQIAEYTFNYTDTTIDRSSRDRYHSSPELDVPLLTSISLPDGDSSYSMEYYTEIGGGVPDLPGMIKKLTLPTGGSYEWVYRWYSYHASFGPQAFLHLTWAGLASRTHRDTDGSTSTWSYEQSTSWTPDPTFPTVKMERRMKVTSPEGHDTVHYFRALPKIVSPQTKTLDTLPTLWDYALPYTRRQDDPNITAVCGNDLFLSVEHYQGSVDITQPTVAGTKVRTECVRYEHDSFDPSIYADPADGYYRDVNRYLASKRIVDHSGSVMTISDEHHYDLDGLGHYRVTVSDGNFSTGNQRKSKRNYNPDAGTYKIMGGNDLNTQDDDPYTDLPGIESPGHSFVMIDAVDPWILNLYDADTVMENLDDVAAIDPSSEIAASQYCFESNTGYLKGQRTLQWGESAGAHDVITRYTRDPQGNTELERYYGGDVQSLGTGELCSLLGNLTGDRFRIGHSWQYGSLQRSWYAKSDGSSFNFYTEDNDIDYSTGWVSVSRSFSGPGEPGLATYYEYDLMGRIVAIDPEPGHGALTRIQYLVASATAPATARVQQLSNSGLETVTLTKVNYFYDGFGRLVREKRRMPDGTWSKRVRSYDEMGRNDWISEWQSNAVPDAALNGTGYTYDLLGRQTAITSPDGSVSNIEYEMDGLTVYLAEVSGVLTEKHERVDRQGRLILVSEWSGTSAGSEEQIDTHYSYDIGGRVSMVRTTDTTVTPATEQIRIFNADNLGFLRSEQQPELGAAGNGETLYFDYDPRGHAGRIVEGGVLNGPYDLSFAYDRAERLLTVKRTSDQLVLQEQDYGLNTPSSWGLGRLQTATAYNYHSGIASEYLLVRESYEYGGVGGRVSVRETTTGPVSQVAGQTYEASFTQGFTWNDLGQVASLSYPNLVVPASHEGDHRDPKRVVTYHYQGGLLSAVAGYVDSIAYHFNGMVKSVQHSNGVLESYDSDPNWMLRPRGITVSGPGGGELWSSGLFSYDGVGNITGIGSDSFSYNSVSRLKTATVDGSTRSYTYDPYGNLKSITRQGVPQNIGVDPATNRLQGASYDTAGNVTQLGGLSFSYYPFNLRRTMDRAGDPWHARYAYNVDGERVATYNPETGITYTIRGLDGKVLREVREYLHEWWWSEDSVWRGNRLVATIGYDDGVKHYHGDHLGNPRVVTDACGDVISTHTYFPYGQEKSLVLGNTERMRFTGHERDRNKETDSTDDLDYMHARYYTPHLARFLSVDPIGGNPHRPQSWNRYSYVSNNPIRLIDPDGREEVTQESLEREQWVLSGGLAVGWGGFVLPPAGVSNPIRVPEGTVIPQTAVSIDYLNDKGILAVDPRIQSTIVIVSRIHFISVTMPNGEVKTYYKCLAGSVEIKGKKKSEWSGSWAEGKGTWEKRNAPSDEAWKKAREKMHEEARRRRAVARLMNRLLYGIQKTSYLD